jgi:hypothetical protein
MKNKKKLHPWFPTRSKTRSVCPTFDPDNPNSAQADGVDGDQVKDKAHKAEVRENLERQKRLEKVAAYLKSQREKYQAAFDKSKQSYIEPENGILAGPQPRRKPPTINKFTPKE